MSLIECHIACVGLIWGILKAENWSVSHRDSKNKYRVYIEIQLCFGFPCHSIQMQLDGIATVNFQITVPTCPWIPYAVTH